MSETLIEHPYVEGWISPEVVDQSGEYVPVDQWNLTEHRKNPVALKNHDRNGPVVGKWQHPDGTYSIEKRKGGLWGRCYFNMDCEEGREEYLSYRNGFKKGFSPGFSGTKPVASFISGKKAFVINNAKLHEVSLVTLPDNQDALATYAKSLREKSGNQTSNDGETVYRYGVLPVSQENTPYSQFVKSLGEVVSVMSTVRESLVAAYGDDVESRNKAYGELKPVYDGLAEFVTRGKAINPSADWETFEKQLAETFTGFEPKTATETPAPSVESLIESAVAPLRQAIIEQNNEIVKRHDEIQALAEVCETLAS